MHRTQNKRLVVNALACGWLLCALLVMGCGQKGQALYDVSGQVTYGGQPVPAGMIIFEPKFKGESARARSAKIKDGRYRTEDGKGLAAGNYEAVIRGFDGRPDPAEPDETPDGMMLFRPFRMKVDIPSEPCTRDFDVPMQRR